MAGRPPFAFMPGMGADFDPMQLMFGQGGNIDPRILEEILGQAAAAGNWNAQAASDPSKKQAPGVSAAALRNLPRVKVAAYDIAANESPECAISLEPLLIGAPAIRLPCGHLFYEDAVKDWLKKSNECPVCRWELPSDDAEHEKGRSERMAGRKVRLRLTDLSVKTAAELRRFAHFLGVDVKDCLEKSELVEKISKSPQVLMISADDEETSNQSVQREPMFAMEDLQNLSIADLRAVLERLSVFGAPDDDKDQLLRRMAECNLIFSDEEAAERRQSAVPMETEEAPPPAAQTESVPLNTRSIGDLKKLAKELGISLSGCLEKDDIVQRLQSSPAYQGDRKSVV